MVKILAKCFFLQTEERSANTHLLLNFNCRLLRYQAYTDWFQQIFLSVLLLYFFLPLLLKGLDCCYHVVFTVLSSGIVKSSSTHLYTHTHRSIHHFEIMMQSCFTARHALAPVHVDTHTAIKVHTNTCATVLVR